MSKKNLLSFFHLYNYDWPKYEWSFYLGYSRYGQQTRNSLTDCATHWKLNGFELMNRELSKLFTRLIN